MNNQPKPHFGLIDPAWKSRAVYSGLVICHAFLEGGGNYTRDLIPTAGGGDLMLDANWSTGPHGPLINLPSNDYITTGITRTETNMASLTISAWVSTVSSGTGREAFISTYYDVDNFFYFGRNNNRPYWELKSGGNYDSQNTEAVEAHRDGTLHSFIGSSGDYDFSWYFDGELIDTNGFGGFGDSTMSAGPWRIGSDADGGGGWVGNISSFQMWNRGLNAKEAKEVYLLGPSLGLNENAELNAPYFGAISQGVSGFNPAWAFNSNRIL